MKIRHFMLPLLLAGSLSACGQFGQEHARHRTIQVDTSNLTHPTVKAAIDAWQQGNAARWQSFFAPDARLFDDGHPRDLRKFSTAAIGHERFITIDKVEEGGLAVFGHFHSDQWGDFTTYFRFHLNAQGKIERLDIGQADY